VSEALIRKLLIKPGHQVAVVNAPEGFGAQLAPLPEGAAFAGEQDASGWADVVLAFMRDRADADKLATGALAAAKPGGVVWLAYPKRSKTVQTDINRDTGWDSVTAAGWLPVTQIAIDEVWSCLRFRPQGEIKSLTRKMSAG
jgi:hypothetical protein